MSAKISSRHLTQWQKAFERSLSEVSSKILSRRRETASSFNSFWLAQPIISSAYFIMLIFKVMPKFHAWNIYRRDIFFIHAEKQSKIMLKKSIDEANPEIRGPPVSSWSMYSGLS